MLSKVTVIFCYHYHRKQQESDMLHTMPKKEKYVYKTKAATVGIL